MVTESGAEIRTRESGVVWRAYLGEVLTVAKENGEWLWIFERQGWLSRKQVVPFDTAVYELNARLAASKRVENYALRGIAYVNHGKYQEAIADFNEVLRRNPNDAGTFVNRGNAHRFLGQDQQAIEDYTQAIRIDAKHFLARNNRAIVNTSLKEYDLALADLQSAINLNKEYPEAHNNRGIVYEELGRYDDAVAEFTTAIKLYPRYAIAYVNRGFAHAKLRKYDQARADLSQAVILAPNDEDVLNDFAWFLATCPSDEYRDGEKALSIAKSAAEISNFQSWEVLDTYAAAHAEKGDFRGATEWARKAIDLAPATEHQRLRTHLVAFRKKQPIRD